MKINHLLFDQDNVLQSKYSLKLNGSFFIDSF